MIAALCTRIEMSARENLMLEVELLETLMVAVAPGDREFFTRHGFGLIGNMHNVERLLDEVLPGARWDIRNTFCGTSICLAVVDASNGTERPFTGKSKVAANAFLAAGLRAYAAVQQPVLPFAVNDDEAPAFMAANDLRRAEA